LVGGKSKTRVDKRRAFWTDSVANGEIAGLRGIGQIGEGCSLRGVQEAGKREGKTRGLSKNVRGTKYN